MKNSIIAGGAVVIAIVLIAGAVMMNGNGSALSERTNREVALTCTTDMATEFHVHPNLSIIISGERQVLPANIGIKPTCMSSLHTHTADGVIHVESPEKRDFTLSDFFAVWGESFTKDEVLGFKADATHQIRVTVNGVEVDTYENTVLKDLEKIVISYE